MTTFLSVFMIGTIAVATAFLVMGIVMIYVERHIRKRKRLRYIQVYDKHKRKIA